MRNIMKLSLALLAAAFISSTPVIAAETQAPVMQKPDMEAVLKDKASDMVEQGKQKLVEEGKQKIEDEASKLTKPMQDKKDALEQKKEALEQKKESLEQKKENMKKDMNPENQMNKMKEQGDQKLHDAAGKMKEGIKKN